MTKRYKVWDPQGMANDFIVEAESITIAAMKALKELGYDIEALREDEE